MKKYFILITSILFQMNSYAQEATGYQVPPKEIKDLIDVPLPPSTMIDSKGENILYIYRDRYQSIEELSKEELRLGGLRIDPVTNIGSRVSFYKDIHLGTTNNTNQKSVKGIPAKAQLANISFSPNNQYVSFTHTSDKGVSLWLIDIKKAEAKQLTDYIINANLGSHVVWSPDSKSILIKSLVANRPTLIDTKTQVPTGPIISESDGEKAQNRTYQDLLKTPNDEFNFEVLAESEIKKVDLNGKLSDFLPKAMYKGIGYSPDGKYVLVSEIKKPFSYLVPYQRFPSEEHIYTDQAKHVVKINETPLTEVLPQGFMSTTEGKRSIGWRSDKPATIYWIEALDGGDPANQVSHRDAVYQLEAPFNAEKELLVKTLNRFSGIIWGDDKFAIVHDRWFANRNTKSYVFNPSDNTQEPFIITDRNYQDNYTDPGNYITTRNKYNRPVMEIHNGMAYLIGAGYTPEGQFPFVEEINLKTAKTKRLYTSTYTDKYESIVRALDIRGGELLVRIESKNEFPNYYIKNIRKRIADRKITNFENPYKSLEEVHKEIISYPREDGLELTGTLYLPAGYDGKEKLPMILWAYPREYKDRATASQSTANENRFNAPNYGSPIFWVTQGYAVLDDAAFPIVGEGDKEPNDSFRSQLVANGKAAIDAVDKLGYIDRNRVGVGGHSYGAFMTANLLSHSDLFAAGIARSGAYNRTLTPFGFQSEERNYWEAPDLYNEMSPFMNAEKVKAPILLIHGEADNNAGTYPMQSERYFNALKGLGATSRLVMLPKESHGYAAKESILHMLWEQHMWLEKYVKNKK